MDIAPKVILWIYGSAAAIVIVLLIYLIIRRIKIKRKENFENRDN